MLTEMSKIKKDFLCSLDGSTISEKDLEKINSLARKTQTQESVYVFNVVLCDNEIDRDFERFSVDALNLLAPMFVGKTGILDHNMQANNQVARIFETRIETDLLKKTRAGENYTKLVARAYMARTQKNQDLIAEIDAGIKKEVSVGCAVSSVKCSICGQDLRRNRCSHKIGEKYKNEVCHGVLGNPTDAYEWSFVAVPAQIGAGVTKSFGASKVKGEQKVRSVIEKVKSMDNDFMITRDELDVLKGEINELKQQARDGQFYKDSLRCDVLKMCATTMPNVEMKTVENILSRASASELALLKSAFAEKMAQAIPPTIQLVPQKQSNKTINSEFKM